MLKTNSQDEIKFLTLIKHLDLMKDMFSEEEIKFTPYLHPDKTARERFSNYRVPSMDLNFLSLTIYKIKFVARLGKSLLIPIIHHLYYRPARKFPNHNLLKNIETIFVSHYTHKGISELHQDFYFGDLPKRTKNKSSQNLVLFINHTRDRNMQRSSIKSNVDFKPLKILLPKTTINKTFIRIYLNQIKHSCKILLKANTNSKKNVIKKIYLYELALQQLSRTTFIQQSLIQNILEICKKTEPRKIMLTYEGHSYETFLARKIDKHLVDMEIGVYQFSALVPAQISFFKNLELLPTKTVIYVSGENSVKQIMSLTSLDKNKIQLIGSHKNNGKSYSVLAKSHDINVLFAPEGNKSSLNDFMVLLGHCIESLPNVNFILRPHPASFRYAQKTLEKTLGSHFNKFLSKNTLEFDLRTAHICIYKSSVVGIQGLQYGVLPIYFSYFDCGVSDPITIADLPHPRVNSHEKLIDELERYSQKKVFQRIHLTESLNQVFEKYFNPINTKIII